jgi:hypothetical protein
LLFLSAFRLSFLSLSAPLTLSGPFGPCFCFR